MLAFSRMNLGRKVLARSTQVSRRAAVARLPDLVASQTFCQRTAAANPNLTVARGFADISPRRTVPSRPSAPQCPDPPFRTVIIYNQSKHASQSVLADIRAVWGNKVRVIQTLESGGLALPGMDATIYIKPKSWGDVAHFGTCLNTMCTLQPTLEKQRVKGKIAFMPGWSAFAESSEAAVKVRIVSDERLR